MDKLLNNKELLDRIGEIAEYLGCDEEELKSETLPLILTQKRLYAEYVIGESPYQGGIDTLLGNPYRH